MRVGEEGCLAELELAAEGVDEDEGGRSSKQREEMGGTERKSWEWRERRGDGDETRCIYSGLIQPAVNQKAGAAT